MPSRYAKRKIKGKTISEHRFVMERELGRPLLSSEVVHHKDHNPFNNDPANLQVMTHAEHSALHNNKHARIKVCALCGSDFEPAPTKRQRQVTCSRQCFREWMRQVANARPDTGAYLSCQGCGVTFRVVPSRADKAKFCGRACAADAHRAPLA